VRHADSGIDAGATRRSTGGVGRPLKRGVAIDKRLLRVDEAAAFLNVSRWTIYRWVREGRLEATRLTKGSLRIFHASVLALIEQHRTFGIEPGND